MFKKYLLLLSIFALTVHYQAICSFDNQEGVKPPKNKKTTVYLNTSQNKQGSQSPTNPQNAKYSQDPKIWNPDTTSSQAPKSSLKDRLKKIFALLFENCPCR